MKIYEIYTKAIQIYTKIILRRQSRNRIQYRITRYVRLQGKIGRKVLENEQREDGNGSRPTAERERMAGRRDGEGG